MKQNNTFASSSILTVRELSVLLRVGINSAYDLVRNGSIPSVRVGRQYRIPLRSVEEFLSKMN